MKKKVFSVEKAVKQNARERLGSPAASFPLPSKKLKADVKRVKKATEADHEVE